MSGSPVPTARCSLKKSKGTLTGPLGALRSSERPSTQVPTRRRHSSGPPVPDPTVTHLRLTATGTVRLQEDHSTLLVSTSGLQEETFMILPFRC